MNSPLMDKSSNGSQRKIFRCLLFAVLTLVLTVAHLAYNFKYGYLLFELEGGVTVAPKGSHDGPIDTSGWTVFGGIDETWENPIYLPGGVCFALGGGPIGILMDLAGSVVSGWASASLLWAVFAWKRPILGRYYWRLLLMIMAWGWVLVPVEFTLVYQWTVKY